MSGKGKGVSHAEKRQRLLNMISEKKDVFQLKELEKLAPKELGINAQAVKDVLQQLVDDALVSSDKIGTFVCFWSFPATAANQVRDQLKNLGKDVETYEKQISEANAKLEILKQGKELTDERSRLLTEFEQQKEKYEQLMAELKKYEENDPDKFDDLNQKTKVAKDAANRWTDNVFAIRQWCQKKYNMDGAVLNKQFCIPENFDYIE